MMKRIGSDIFLIVGLILIIAGLAGTAAAQTDSCVTAKCHAGMGKDKTVHSPVKDGMCTTCHQIVQNAKGGKHPGNLTITLVQQGEALCSMCHEPKNKKKVVHAPVQGGDCTSCHDPHQSPNKGMLKETMPKLCFQCHPDSMVKHKVVASSGGSGRLLGMP